MEIKIHEVNNRYVATALGYDSGVGMSPDEAIGHIVRQAYLSCDEVTITDISSCDAETQAAECPVCKQATQ